MPGRIVGKSIDVDGNEAFCLTLSTREQHIRRHRATSNICTNETLIALMGAMHMSLLGPEGLKLLAQRNMAACQLAKEKIGKISGISLPHESGYHYNEFAIELPGSASDCLEYLDSRGVIGGLDLSNWYPDKTNWMLVSVSDQTTSNDIEMLCARISIWCESVPKGVEA
jgi:glycine dehydrogenase subunit 1